jgi:hypothetical protein
MSPEELLKALRDAVYKKMPCPMIHVHDMKNFTIRYDINPVQYYNQLLMQPDKKYKRKQLKLEKPTSQ